MGTSTADATNFVQSLVFYSFNRRSHRLSHLRQEDPHLKVMKRLVCLFLIIMVSEVVVEGLSIQGRNDLDPCVLHGEGYWRNDLDPCVLHGEGYCQYRCRQQQLSGFCNEENRCICYYDPNNFF
ncbi:hypothetical protein Bbelb_303300 [Branchiostoma belcheri]|nr:hypothetical protein Bbelb_303300 [Branchiostoma belcheri]